MSGLADRLQQLEEAHAKATPGVWKLWGMDVLADQDGTSNVDTAVPVAHTSYRDDNGKPRTFDAQLICDMHRHLPDLIAAVRAVLALADQWEAGMRAMGYADGHHDGASAIRAALDPS